MGDILARLRQLLARVAGSRAGGARGSATPPDWSRIDDYSTLYRAIPQAHFPDQRAFLDGPLERYLELVEAAPGRPGARIMEHVGASLRWYRDSEAAQGRSTEWLDANADAIVRARFAADSENDRYMIEVFEGRATHNYRASDEEDD